MATVRVRIRQMVRRRALGIVLGLMALLALAWGRYFLWYRHRPRPSPIEESWFSGVHYVRLVRREPRPLVLHFVSIDLHAPAIDFLVTPPDGEGEHPLRGQTTSAFLDRHRLAVAINGSFFFPWHSKGPLDYYPRVGDPVSVHGLAISGGVRYSEPDPEYTTLFLAPGRASFGNAFDADHALSGREVFVREGRFALSPALAAQYATLEPRTAVALSRDERRLLLCVVDGRQPNYSEGVTMEEMATFLIEQGAWTALHLDGGGSSVLVRASEDGKAVIVNSPIHGRHPPGRERPVANHLGVFARRPVPAR